MRHKECQQKLWFSAKLSRNSEAEASQYVPFPSVEVGSKTFHNKLVFYKEQLAAMDKSNWPKSQFPREEDKNGKEITDKHNKDWSSSNL